MVKNKTDIKKDIKETVLRFGKVIQKQGISIEKLIVFGSQAKGTANPDSDIDVCVVSPQFGNDHIEEMQFLFKQRRSVDRKIEPFPISSKEYKNRDITSSIIFEIKKFGKEVQV